MSIRWPKYILSLIRIHPSVLFWLINEEKGEKVGLPWPTWDPRWSSQLFSNSVAMALHLTCSWLVLLVWTSQAAAKSQIYQPVDVGFQFSTPVNLANTLQNSVAGPLSVVLVVAFTGILFAGLVRNKLPSPWAARSSIDDQSRYKNWL